ncbi:heterophilic cell-cell adhesion via plasma membrane cell adhesion molecules [Dermatophagoides pteronyssinus]|uniref:Heterophilic cell-cell adhesion via plasma membrane cell adhesion molecules n=1 Tax=Dermatophagoides pteronyssinus TaxID=6956 RepID=A0ABQ8JJA2_DERPT|nr:heterophilic cell-cell adhesion via plasma membrane cell adhesion molecules [Dermatophagoides pteronyssinus]
MKKIDKKLDYIESIIDHYFRIKPNDIYVIEGDSTELKCQINPDIDNYGPVQWSKDGFLLALHISIILIK